MSINHIHPRQFQYNTLRTDCNVPTMKSIRSNKSANQLSKPEDSRGLAGFMKDNVLSNQRSNVLSNSSSQDHQYTIKQDWLQPEKSLNSHSSRGFLHRVYSKHSMKSSRKIQSKSVCQCSDTPLDSIPSFFAKASSECQCTSTHLDIMCPWHGVGPRRQC